MGTNDALTSTEDAVTAGANDAPLPAPPEPPRKARRATSRTSDFRVAEQPAYVLHSYPYRETSLIIDVLTRDHGRLALVAKGAKRPHSSCAAYCRPSSRCCCPIRQIRGAHADGRRVGRRDAAARRRRGLCGFYANELLVKFCAREDPQPPLFNHYVLTLTRLAHGEPAVQVLRSFERVLLRETGYAMALNRTVARRAVGRSSLRVRSRAWRAQRGRRSPVALAGHFRTDVARHGAGRLPSVSRRLRKARR